MLYCHLFEVIDSFDRFIHLAHISKHLNYDTIQEFVHDLFHFLFTVVVKN